MKMKTSVFFASAFAFAAATSFAADLAYTWTQGDTSLGDGAVTFAYSGDAITAITAAPDAKGRITLSGDPMTFAADATITFVEAGTLALSNAVTTAGRLSVIRTDEVLSWTGGPGEPGGKAHAFLAYTNVNVFTVFTSAQMRGTKIEDIEVVGSQLNAAHTTCRRWSGFLRPGAVRSITTESGEKCRYYSLNRYATVPWDNNTTKTCTFGAFVQLRQNESGDVRARMYWGGYSSANVDVSATGDLYAMATAEPKTANNSYWCTDDRALSSATAAYVMAIDNLVIRRKDAASATVRFEGACTFGGETDVGTGATAVVVGADRFTTNIGGSGEFRFEPAAGESTQDERFEGYVADVNHTPTGWSVVATNRLLSALVSVSGYIHGGACYPDATGLTAGLLARSYYLTNDAQVGACQMQEDSGSTVRDLNVRFRQNGPNVEAQLFSAFYAYKGIVDGTNPQLGADFLADYDSWPASTSSYSPAKDIRTLTNSAKPASGKWSGHLGLHNVTLTFSDPKMTLAGVNVMAPDTLTTDRPKLTFAGADGRYLHVDVVSNTAFPSNGVVTVGADTDVRLAADSTHDNNGYSDSYDNPKAPSTTLIRVLKGGILQQGSKGLKGTIGRQQSVELLGGWLICEGGSEKTAKCYLNNLTVSDGARISGNPPQAVHGMQKATWKVTGSSPSFFDAGIEPLSTSGQTDASKCVLTFDVEDVTKDKKVDCTIGKFFPYTSTNYHNYAVVKKGAGTMKMTGDAKAVRNRVDIQGGTILYGASNIATNDVLLSGGALAAAEGTSNSLGKLTVTKPTTITLADGATLAFSDVDFSAAAVGSRSIVINADLAKSTVRFGATLTGAQLGKIGILVDGKVKRAAVDENGDLYAASGLMIIVR